MSEDNPFELFPLLRIAQVRLEQGKYDAAEAILERGGRINEGNIHEIGIAGLRLVLAMLYNARGDEVHLKAALGLTAEAIALSAENPQLGEQYQMAAACESAAIHLRLTQSLVDKAERTKHASQALKMSEIALEFFESSGFVRPIECVSEEVLYRHSRALAENGREAEAIEFLQHAHAAMMEKHELIPEDSRFRRTYLENIPLHREICAAFAAIG